MAVINRTECWTKSIRQATQGIVLVMMVLGAAVLANPQGCEQARQDVVAVGFPASSLLDRPVDGEICGENSCCTKEAEKNMMSENKLQIETFLKDSISKLSSLVDIRAKKFDGLFREMMNHSKNEFHEMFQKTYGKIYLQNSDVFSDFFKELESYYKKGSLRLSDTLEAFFGILYQRMFTVINSQYTFEEKYLMCVTEHMADVKPFGDLPKKFTVQLRRSFVATRTYHKALSTAAEAAKKLVNVRIDRECEKELMIMQHCGACKGSRGNGTCFSYCAAVLGSCLRHHTAFSEEWNNFIDALDKVADRLVGPYNIEGVVEPLNIKISEAIMNFQESGAEVSKKIYSLCGTPTLNRRRRDTDAKDDLEVDPAYEINPIKMHYKKKKKAKKYDDEEAMPSLGKLIKEIKIKIRETRQFWAHLPYQYCNNITAPVSSAACWNGTSIGEFTQTTPRSPGSISPLVREETYNLQVFSDKLRKAYHGDEVEIIDDSEDSVDGSGSGSGDFEIEEDDKDPVKEPDDFETITEIPVKVVPTSSTTRPEVTRTISGGANAISLSRALAQYLLPIVLVWFGGAISDLL